MKRYSPIAGSWYPGDPIELTAEMRNLFVDTKFGPGYDPKSQQKSCDQKLVGIGSPHAGYFFSGSVAANSYAHLYAHHQKIDTAIILGPNHQFPFPEISIFPEGTWELPLGEVEIDTEIVEMAKTYENPKFRDIVEFETESQRVEHSIEIQIPFLQYLYGNNFKFIPICYGNQDFSKISIIVADFLKYLIDTLHDRTIAIIASSDLSHEPNIARLEKNDHTMLDLLVTNRLEDAVNFRDRVGMTMCGYGPFFTLAKLTQLMGIPHNQLLKYAHSSQIRPNHRGPYTVGYPSVAFEVASNQ